MYLKPLASCTQQEQYTEHICTYAQVNTNNKGVYMLLCCALMYNMYGLSVNYVTL